MVRAPAYFRARTHDLQFLYSINNVVDSLGVLIRDLSDRFQNGEAPFACYTSKLFRGLHELLKSLSRLLTDNPDPRSQLIVPNTHELQEIWRYRNTAEAQLVAELYMEFLTASLFENLYVDNELNIYFEINWKGWDVRNWSCNRDLVEKIRNHFARAAWTYRTTGVGSK